MNIPTAVAVTGATGLVGTQLVRTLAAAGAEIRVVARDPNRARGKLPAAARIFRWQNTQPEPGALEAITAVVHLAGEPIFHGRLSAARKNRIRSSRIDTTRGIVSALAELPSAARPTCLICASAVGYYGSHADAVICEDAPAGSGFLADVCRDWEAEAVRAEVLGVRVVCLRIGLVLARTGGALPLLVQLFRLGLGGPLGNGRQWLSWIQLDDLVSLIRFASTEEKLAGAVNATSPEPARNGDFTRELARQLKRPAFFRVPASALHLALGELAGELLNSRRVVPARVQAAGFHFAHPELEGALSAVLNKRKGHY